MTKERTSKIVEEGYLGTEKRRKEKGNIEEQNNEDNEECLKHKK